MSRKKSMNKAGENFFLAWKNIFLGFTNTGKAVTGIE
jgi:hypothetical protein